VGTSAAGALERVLGVLLVAQDVTADAEHLRAVPPHEHLERRRVAAGDELLQQLRVRQFAALGNADHPTQIAGDGGSLPVGHGGRSPVGASSTNPECAGGETLRGFL
jgi:hypothetical protein